MRGEEVRGEVPVFGEGVTILAGGVASGSVPLGAAWVVAVAHIVGIAL